MSENDNLYLCAENFKAATDFNHYFVTGNNKRILMNLKISSFIEEFTHIVGFYKGQEKPYTILQEKKINIKTHEETLLYQHPKYKDPAVASKCIEKLDEINQIADKIADAIDNGEISKEQEQTLPGRSK